MLNLYNCCHFAINRRDNTKMFTLIPCARVISTLSVPDLGAAGPLVNDDAAQFGGVDLGD